MKSLRAFSRAFFLLLLPGVAAAQSPVVDGKLDASYTFFKQISLEDDHVPPRPAARGVLYKYEICDTVWFAYVESRAVNDNVFSSIKDSTAYAGWVPGPGHTFSDLSGSDKLRLQLIDPGGSTVFDASLDYIFKDSSAGPTVSWLSGIKTTAAGHTFTKYDGTAPASVVGLAALKRIRTSIEYDVNVCSGGTPPTDSPRPEPNVCWEYRIVYEMKFYKGALGFTCADLTDTAKVQVPLVHNSPAKGIVGITGFKFFDENCNGVWDHFTELGLGGWKICLDGTGTCVDQCTYTTPQGYYEFYVRTCANSNFQLPTGTYVLAETLLTGYTQCVVPPTLILGSRQVVVQQNFGNDKLPECPLPSTTPPVVDGLLDSSYQFFKQISDTTSTGKPFHGVLYKFETCDTVWFAYVESRGVNDNVFDPIKDSVAYAGWVPGSGHKFDDLLGSDRLEFTLIDPGSATTKFSAELDYIFRDSLKSSPNTVSWLSGIKTSGSGHDFDGYDGTAPGSVTGLSALKAIQTSLQYDVNVCSVALLPGHPTSSPRPEPDVAGCWEYRIIYEMKFYKGAGGLGLSPCSPTAFDDTSKVQVPGVHNSPAKKMITITGFKFCDADSDGVWDHPGEPGLSGWTINLSHTPVVACVNQSTTTNVQGYYEFYLRTCADANGHFKLPTGSYTVSETVMGGYTQTFPGSPGTYTLSTASFFDALVEVGVNFGNNPDVGGGAKIIPGGGGNDGIRIEAMKSAETPAQYALEQNYPNPFNPTTTIQFALPEPSHVRLSVYNVLGQEVARLVDRDLRAGFQQVVWHYGNTLGYNLASGVYFYRMTALSSTSKREFVDVKKLLLLK